MSIVVARVGRDVSPAAHSRLARYNVNGLFSIIAPNVGEEFSEINPLKIEFRGGSMRFTEKGDQVWESPDPRTRKAVTALALCGLKIADIEDLLKPKTTKASTHLDQAKARLRRDQPQISRMGRSTLLTALSSIGALEHDRPMSMVPTLTPQDLILLEHSAIGLPSEQTVKIVDRTKNEVRSARLALHEILGGGEQDPVLESLAAAHIFATNPEFPGFNVVEPITIDR